MDKKSLPKSWKGSEKSIRAVQLAFEFGKTVAETIRRQANKNDLSPSDQIRSILELEVKKPVRPRLTVSLSADDYQILAQRFNVDVNNKAAIRLAIRDILIRYGEKLHPE